MSAANLPMMGRMGSPSPPRLSDVVNDTHLERRVDLREQFARRKPFSFVVIDDFVKPDVAEMLADEFPPMHEMAKVFREPWVYKGQLSDIEQRQPIVATFQSEEFREFITSITNVSDLLCDPMLAGSGFHQYPSRGFQDPHVDPNFHPFDKKMHRRVNFLLYLAKDWQARWGGEFEVWDEKDRRPTKRVACFAPQFNRAIVFYSSGRSWHGVSKVSCPEGITRKSLAIAFYTTTRPLSEVYRDSSAIWYSPHSIVKRLTYPLANAGIALLKPHVSLLRRFRRNVFDASGKFESRTIQQRDARSIGAGREVSDTATSAAPGQASDAPQQSAKQLD
jgi:hypothetical protein